MQPTEQEANKVLPAGADSDTGGRIRAIMDHYQLGPTATNERLGYKGRNSKLHKLLSNDSRPGYETLLDLLAAFPDVSADWLLTGAGPMLRGAASPTPTLPLATESIAPYGVPQSTPTPPRNPTPGGSLVGRVLTVTVDKDGEENTALVPVVAQAGYTRQHNEAVFLQGLRQYRIPGFEHGTYRAFEVAGDSMEPTLNHRDIVVGSIVEELRLLEPGEVYVVVTNESVMLKRIKDRVRATDTEVLLHSDNPHRKPFGLETRDIIQLWRVRGYVSSYLPSAPDVTIERLWEVIEQLGFDKGEVRRHLAEDAPNPAPSR